jgi:hypothetical protein
MSTKFYIKKIYEKPPMHVNFHLNRTVFFFFESRTAKRFLIKSGRDIMRVDTAPHKYFLIPYSRQRQNGGPKALIYDDRTSKNIQILWRLFFVHCKARLSQLHETINNISSQAEFESVTTHAEAQNASVELIFSFLCYWEVSQKIKLEKLSHNTPWRRFGGGEGERR